MTSYTKEVIHNEGDGNDKRDKMNTDRTQAAFDRIAV